MYRTIVFSLLILTLFSVDIYSLQLRKTVFSSRRSLFFFRILVISSTFISIIYLIFDDFFNNTYPFLRVSIQLFISIAFFSKLMIVIFLTIDDGYRLLRFIKNFIIRLFYPKRIDNCSPITRSKFLSKLGIGLVSIPAIGLTYGVAFGAHDYKVRKIAIYLDNLPLCLEGIRMGHISDIHCGSFFNKRAVENGVAMFMREKPDIVFFTGDLVNNLGIEVRDYANIFSRIKAPLGSFSVLGNHDYGDYVKWNSVAAKEANFRSVIEAHKKLSWRLLMDENINLKIDGENISIIGVQNWGARGHFPKYGDLKKACNGVPNSNLKILLSHDPSHWESEILPKFSFIDITLSGHTHGMQFGVEIDNNYKWSPVQYLYKQWAGLYHKNSQYLYVNRGFGYIGFPGRVGIPPELTVIELRKKHSLV